MSARPLSRLLACLMPLAGCAAVNSASTTPINPIQPEGVYQNWQIQSGTALTSPPTGPTYMLGALQVSGTTATGIFNTDPLCPAVPTTNLSFVGTLSPSGTLNLISTPIPGQIATTLTIPADATSVATGTISSLGAVCALALQSPAVGTEVAPVTGTFAGAATATSTIAPYPIGTVTLALTQSATPNTLGQFPLTGSLTFTSGACTSTTPVLGTIGGLGLTLTSASNYVTLTAGGTTPAASQLTSAAIAFPVGPCPASTTAVTYGGTFIRQ